MEHRTSGAGRLSAFGVIAGALFVIGPALAWLGIVRGLVAFVLFGLGGLTGVVVGVTSVIQAARGRGLGRGGAVALAVGVVFLALASRGAGKPRINDFTTDPADPPALAHAATLPPNVARDMSYPKAFADIQRGCCADLHPARVRAGVPEAFARAEAVARQMGLTVTSSDSRIDVRSKSRDGQGDLGVNAARIRTFVAALEAGAPTPP